MEYCERVPLTFFKVIISRFAKILEVNEHAIYKLKPHLRGVRHNTVDPDAYLCFDNFEFVIYTAISNMLQEQTARRVADPQSKVCKVNE